MASNEQFFEREKKEKSKLSNRFKKIKSKYHVAGEPLIDLEDAVLLFGKYDGLSLSFVEAINPDYTSMLLKSDNVESELKEIIVEVKKRHSLNMETIKAQIAMY